MSEAGLSQSERRRAGLARVERLTRLTDTGLRIPFTGVRFGLDALIGLIPVAGDLTGVVLSLYLYAEARRMGAPGRVRRRMIRNILIDLVGGLIPVVGDLFDFVWRSNQRNADLLRDWLHEELRPAGTEGRSANPLLWMLLAVVALLVVGTVFWPDVAAELVSLQVGPGGAPLQVP